MLILIFTALLLVFNIFFTYIQEEPSTLLCVFFAIGLIWSLGIVCSGLFVYPYLLSEREKINCLIYNIDKKINMEYQKNILLEGFGTSESVIKYVLDIEKKEAKFADNLLKAKRRESSFLYILLSNGAFIDKRVQSIEHQDDY